MVGKLRNPSDRSNASTTSVMTATANKEYFWACDLTTDKRTRKWHIPIEELEEDDEDYIEHTLVVRSVCLGAGAVEKEENIVVMESVGEDGEVFKGTVANLTKGVNPMVANLSLTVDGKSGVTFTLVEGSGPISICGNRLMEYPEDEDLDASQTDESLLQEELEDCKEEEGTEEDSSYMEEKAKSKQTAKRKAPAAKSNKGKQKAKMEEEEDDDEEDDEDDDDDEDDEDEDEEDEESEEDVKSKKTKKDVGKNAKGKPKAPVPVKNGKAKKVKK